MQKRPHREVIPLSKPPSRWGAIWRVGVVVMAGVGFAGGYVAAAPDQAQALVRSTVGSLGLAGCNIKGNVSINSGERIYHVPGQRHYDETIIRLEYGERWFCTEKDAREAGWRRSGI